MTPAEVVAELDRLGVSVVAAGGRFRLKADHHPHGASGLIPEPTRAAMVEHKDEVLALLGVPCEPCWVCGDRVSPTSRVPGRPGVVSDCEPRRREADGRARAELEQLGQPVEVPPCPFAGGE